MTHVGTHLILDAWGAPGELLDDPKVVREAVLAAVRAGRATLIECCLHEFSPQGVTATATLAESHIAVHTWPEHGYFGADLFFCGSGDANAAMDKLIEELRPREVRLTRVPRGTRTAPVAQTSLRVEDLLGERS